MSAHAAGGRSLTVSDAGRVRSSIRTALSRVGGSLESDGDAYVIDLSSLDDRKLVTKRQAALQTTASLLFQVDDAVPIVARLPETPRGRRALAASGLMFALVQHHARFDEEPGADDPESLFSAAGLHRLAKYESWSQTFTPFDVELREFMLGAARPDADATRRADSLAGRGLGTFDDDFAAFVNPHELPLGSELSAISEVAAPWLRRLLDRGREDAVADVRWALMLLGHALDNIREHAFLELADARSLVTLGIVDVGSQKMCRLQILDNGIGIPASLRRQVGSETADSHGAGGLLSLAVHGHEDGYDPLLSWGRGQGLPEMRRLTGVLGGRLSITTSGPDGSMITILCEGDQPSEPYADLVPIVGTIVTLWIPLSRATTSAADPQEELDL